MRDPEPLPGRLLLDRVLLAGSLVLLAVHLLRYGGELVDDAFISLRYARNLVEGHGLVFNPGERVEGYTNFLWVLAGAGALALGLPAVATLQALSAALAVATAAAVHRVGRRLAPGGPGPLVWLLPLPAFAYWGTTALETMAFAGLATFAFLLAAAETTQGRRRGSVLLFVLLGLTRPEGPLLFALAHAGFAVAGRRSLGRADVRRRLGDATLFAVLWGAWFLARWSWYGEMLPNTFHATVTGGAEQLLGGLSMVGRWALHHPVWTLALAGAPVLGWRRTGAPGGSTARGREGARLLLAGGLVALGWVLYVLAVGGDFMPWWRFLVPITPLLALLVPLALAEVGDRARSAGSDRRRSVLILGLSGLWGLHVAAPWASEEPMRTLVADRTTEVGLEVGAFLRTELPAEALLALNTAGAVPWASDLETLDMLGLTDAEIARHPVYVVSPRWAGHRRGWGDYVLSRRPAAIVWYNSAGLAEPHYLGDRQLADSPRFRFFYQLRRDLLPARPPEGTLLGRFLGAPFGRGRSPELGLDATVLSAAPLGLSWTEVRSSPILFHWFRRRDDLMELWPLWDEAASPERFLELAARHWAAAVRPPVDPAVRARVDALCDRALEAIESGRPDAARPLLEDAVALARRAGSARPFQYVTNLAVLDGSLPLAVQAQIEALRLEPANELYRRNLRSLLTVPWARLGAVPVPGGSG